MTKINKMEAIYKTLGANFYIDGEDEKYATLIGSKADMRDAIASGGIPTDDAINIEDITFPAIIFDTIGIDNQQVFDSEDCREVVFSAASEYFRRYRDDGPQFYFEEYYATFTDDLLEFYDNEGDFFEAIVLEDDLAMELEDDLWSGVCPMDSGWENGAGVTIALREE